MTENTSKSAVEIHNKIKEGSLTSVGVVQEVFQAISNTDSKLEAFTEVYKESALEAAKKIDQQIAAGEDPGPLAGVPFSIKANICSQEGETDAASQILKGFNSPYPATVVNKLIEAGGVLIGKTNMDEFGMGSSTENSSKSTTKNPWDTGCVPGGSSGGAASAASAYGYIHLGSDTGGSIRQPSSYCGVTGLKPTYGRVSRFGLLAFASSLDQIGPISRTAEECALALSIISGKDPRDSTSAEVPHENYLENLTTEIEGSTLGIPKEYFEEGIEPEVRQRIEETIDQYRALGVGIEEVSLPHTSYANPTYVLISAAEASSNLSRYDGIHYGHRSDQSVDLEQLYSNSRGEGFGPEVKRRILVGTFVLSSGYYDAFYRKAMKVRRLIRKDFEDVFKKVDAVICPTSPVPAFPLGSRLDDPLKLYLVDILTVSANLAGIPGISFPCGFTSAGLPVGTQLLGRPFEESRLLSLVHAFQSQSDHHLRRPPVLEGS